MRMFIRRTLLTLLITTLLLISLLPEIVRWQALRTLAGLGIEAELDYLSISLTKGDIGLSGLRLNDGKGNGAELSSLDLQIQLMPLLDRQLIINEFAIAGLDINLADQMQFMLGNMELKESAITISQATSPSGPELSSALSLAMPGDLNFEDIAITHKNAPLIDLAATGLRGVSGTVSNSADNAPESTVNVDISEVYLLRAALFPRNTKDFAFKNHPNHIGFEELLVKHLEFQQSTASSDLAPRLKINNIHLGSIRALAAKNADGSYPLLQIIQELTPKSDSPGQAKDSSNNAEGKPLKLTIDELAIDGENHFLFHDATHSPATAIEFKETAFYLSGIEQGNAEASSPFKFHSAAGDYGSIDIQGDIQLFSSTANVKAKGEINSIDLADVSTYLEELMIHRVNSGHLNAKVEVNIAKDNIDGFALLDLQKFYLEPLSKAEQTAPGNSSALPISSALNLLRDDDDRIKFKLPVSGNINEPDFSVQHILGIVARKAISEAIINYYTPFGLIGLASALVDSATALRFEPIAYQAGTEKFSGIAEAQVDKLAQLLKQKKSLTLTLCPVSSALDRAQRYSKKDEKPLTEEQSTSMEELAKGRGSQLKERFIQQGIGAHQIILCKARHDEKVEKEGFVSIEI